MWEFECTAHVKVIFFIIHKDSYAGLFHKLTSRKDFLIFIGLLERKTLFALWFPNHIFTHTWDWVRSMREWATRHFFCHPTTLRQLLDDSTVLFAILGNTLGVFDAFCFPFPQVHYICSKVRVRELKSILSTHLLWTSSAIHLTRQSSVVDKRIVDVILNKKNDVPSSYILNESLSQWCQRPQSLDY